MFKDLYRTENVIHGARRNYYRAFYPMIKYFKINKPFTVSRTLSGERGSNSPLGPGNKSDDDLSLGSCNPTSPLRHNSNPGTANPYLQNMLPYSTLESNLHRRNRL